MNFWEAYKLASVAIVSLSIVLIFVIFIRFYIIDRI